MKKTTILLFFVTITLLASCSMQQKKFSGQLPLPPLPTSPGAFVQELLAVGRAVPAWSTPWAADHVGLKLANADPVTGEFDQSLGDITYEITGYDLVLPLLYYTDVAGYILPTLKLGQPLDPTLVWKTMTIKKPDGTPYTNLQDGWIVTSARTDVIGTKVPSTSFAVNPDRYNAILTFACTCDRVRSGTTDYGCKDTSLTSLALIDFTEYSCNGVDLKKLKVKQDRTLESTSGQGSWMIKDFPLKVAIPTGTVIVTNTGTGGATGTVTSVPTGISCTTGTTIGCSAVLAQGTVTLTATPTGGATVSWTGCTPITRTNDCTLTLGTTETKVTATFAAQTTTTAPDLIVKTISISPSNPPPRTTPNFQVIYEIQNIGNADFDGTFRVEILKDGVPVNPPFIDPPLPGTVGAGFSTDPHTFTGVDKLAANGGSTGSLSSQQGLNFDTAGTHTITVKLRDVTSTPTETNTGNNQETTTVQIGTTTTAETVSFTLQPGNPGGNPSSINFVPNTQTPITTLCADITSTKTECTTAGTVFFNNLNCYKVTASITPGKTRTLSTIKAYDTNNQFVQGSEVACADFLKGCVYCPTSFVPLLNKNLFVLDGNYKVAIKTT